MSSRAIILLLFVTYVICDNMRGLHIEGNQIKNNQGQVVHIHGINRAGSEYACVAGWGFFDGPVDQWSIDRIRSWNINTVRLPMNEDCWLNINGVNPKFAGDNYKRKLREFVDLLTNNSMAVILDLHWATPGSMKSDKQLQMPNKDHSPQFWRECAEYFKNYDNVIFDLFNEPFPGNGCGDYCSDKQWDCWKNGGQACREADSQIWWDAAGMQDLVNAARASGAKNILMLGGLAWSNSITKWEQYKPFDQKNQLAVSWHSYNFNYLNNEALWDRLVAPLAAKYPIITGEMGENDCTATYITSLMNWADKHGVHYVGWAWNPYSCKDFPALISNYDGTPTGFGVGLRDHLRSKY